jgi:hypothetical protein
MLPKTRAKATNKRIFYSGQLRRAAVTVHAPQHRDARQKCHSIGTKKKHRSLLADLPGVGISKISEDVKRWPFRQLPSDAIAANKIYKVFSLGHGSWVRARIVQACPITPKQAPRKSTADAVVPVGAVPTYRAVFFKTGAIVVATRCCTAARRSACTVQ